MLTLTLPRDAPLLKGLVSASPSVSALKRTAESSAQEDKEREGVGRKEGGRERDGVHDEGAQIHRHTQMTF